MLGDPTPWVSPSRASHRHRQRQSLFSARMFVELTVEEVRDGSLEPTVAGVRDGSLQLTAGEVRDVSLRSRGQLCLLSSMGVSIRLTGHTGLSPASQPRLSLQLGCSVPPLWDLGPRGTPTGTSHICWADPVLWLWTRNLTASSNHETGRLPYK